MHFLQLSLLFALAFRPLASGSTPPLLAPNWKDMHTKHRWNAVPGKWRSIGQPSVGTTIDLRIALTPHHDGALMDTLYEVSTPKHPRHVLFSVPPPTNVLKCGISTLQIWRIPL